MEYTNYYSFCDYLKHCKRCKHSEVKMFDYPCNECIRDDYSFCDPIEEYANDATGDADIGESMQWIPITYREVTEEERIEDEIDEDVAYIFTCRLPDDGDEVLISRNNGKWVSLVTFCNGDYGVGDEDGNDWIFEVQAWMPLPKGYVKERDKKRQLL